MLAALIALGLYSLIMTIVLFVLLYFWDKERDEHRAQVGRLARELNDATFYKG